MMALEKQPILTAELLPCFGGRGLANGEAIPEFIKRFFEGTWDGTLILHRDHDGDCLIIERSGTTLYWAPKNVKRIRVVRAVFSTKTRSLFFEGMNDESNKEAAALFANTSADASLFFVVNDPNLTVTLERKSGILYA